MKRKTGRRLGLATLALACLAAVAVVGSAEPSLAKKGKRSIAGTYAGPTDDYGGYSVALKVSKSGVVSPFQLQMVIYGKDCGTSRLASIPAPIKLKRVTRSKLEGEYRGMDGNAIDKLGVQLTLKRTTGEIRGTVKTERVVGVDPNDEYNWPCIGQTAFRAKR